MAKVRLSTVRQAVIEYFSGDQMRHLDMSTLCPREDGTFSIEGKTFSQVSGFVKLGQGVYSDVYEIDDKRVLKIVKKSDTGYARFAAKCQQHKGNPHLPKITFAGEWAGKTCYVLERLSEKADSEQDLPYYDCNLKDYFRDAINEKSSNPFLGLATEYLRVVAELMNDLGSNDLHGGNIMFRGDVPVITDPLADGDS